MPTLPLARLGLLAALATACHGKTQSANAPASVPQGDTLAQDVNAPAKSNAPPPLGGAFDTDTETRLAAWFREVGPVRPNESFGHLIVRAGKVQLGKPYLDEPSPLGPEVLTCRLDTFECVTFVESTLAISRCIWQKRGDEACFASNLAALRYRGGHMAGYPSRLHYFEDWLQDNAARGVLRLMTQELGGKPVSQPTTYMTGHPDLFPAMVDPANRAAITETEARVSAMHPAVVDRTNVHAVEPRLQEGDVVAVAISRPDILVSHTGFIARGEDGVVRLLHASSFRHHVVLSEQDLAQYVLRRPERRGVLIARPLPPS